MKLAQHSLTALIVVAITATAVLPLACGGNTVEVADSDAGDAGASTVAADSGLRPPPPPVDSGGGVAPGCAGRNDGDRWGASPSQRCCHREALDFSLPTANTNDHCGACGRHCIDGTQCVRTKQGYYFCVGCDPQNVGLNQHCETNCCSHSWDKAENVDGQFVDTGICTASNCAGACDPGNCPAQSTCLQPPNSSFPCVYQ